MSARRSSLAWLVLLCVPVALWLYRATRDPWPGEQGIAVPEGEPALAARAIASAVAGTNAARESGRPFTRQAFAKAHGCARAVVSVPELEPRLRHGVFARPAEYAAWVRFSSGDVRLRSDQLRDARGLALKLTGVAGPKLLEPERGADSQDFLLSDSPRFFAADALDYTLFAESSVRGELRGYYLAGSWNPLRWRVRGFYLAARARRGPPSSLLQTDYYSQTPYRLGPEQFVKYAARPCQPRRPPRQDRTDGMLRQGLKEELGQADACFELLVQLQVRGRNMPIEDASVLWSEADSPFLPVARVLIPKQDVGDPARDALCEDLSFTPWHSLPAHEPVGGVNRLRRAVYQELSRYRHARNGTPRQEPRGDCVDLTGASCRGSAFEAAAAAPSPPAASPSPAAQPPSRPRPRATPAGEPAPAAGETAPPPPPEPAPPPVRPR